MKQSFIFFILIFCALYIFWEWTMWIMAGITYIITGFRIYGMWNTPNASVLMQEGIVKNTTSSMQVFLVFVITSSISVILFLNGWYFTGTCWLFHTLNDTYHGYMGYKKAAERLTQK